MRRKLVAIGMIGLMVFTVFGSTAVAGKPTNAGTMSSPIYTVTPPLPNVWFRYNNHGRDMGGSPGELATASSNGNKLTSSSSSTGTYGTDYAVSDAWVGVQWSLNPLVNWDKVKNKPVTVTAIFGYKFSGSGPDSHSCSISIKNPGSQMNHIIYLKDSSSAYAVNSPLKVVHYRTTLLDLSTGPGQGQINMCLSTYAGGTSMASASATVYDIQLQFA